MSIIFEEVADNLFNENIKPDSEKNNDNDIGHSEIVFEADPASAESEETRTVEPKKRVVRNPRPRLTIQTLCGLRGLHTIGEYFKDIKYKGKGHENHDLNEVMRRLQHWGHRMYPTYKFDDVLTNIERLGKKKELNVHMTRYRLGVLEEMTLNEVNNEEFDDGAHVNENNDDPANNIEAHYDEFDALLDEQIAISKLEPHTPITVKNISSGTLVAPSLSKNIAISTPYTEQKQHRNKLGDTSEYPQPLSPSQAGTSTRSKKLTLEQMARIAKNRRLAQERLKAKLAISSQIW